jgi:hypothetical protein
MPSRFLSSPTSDGSQTGPVGQWSLLAGLVALLVYVAQHRHGIGLTPDGWAAWQGAVSIAEGKDYRYFSGNPIVAWPPLYPLYLAAWTKALGPYGLTLIVANGMLLVLQASAWLWLSLVLFRETALKVHIGVLTAAVLFVGLFVPLNQQAVLAQNLAYTLLPVFLACIWIAMRKQTADWLLYTCACFLGAALLTTHNASVVFVAAGAGAVVVLGRHGLMSRLATAALLVLSSLGAGIVVRWSLGQVGSHPIVGGQQSPLANLVDAGIAIGTLLAPDYLALPVLLALVVIAALIWRGSSGSRAMHLRFAVLVSVAATSILSVIFSLVWLNGSLSEGRHLLFAPLLIVPLLMYAAGIRTLMLLVVVALVLPPLAYRNVKWGFLIPPAGLVPAMGELTRGLRTGEVVATSDGRLLIGPDSWEEPAGGYSSHGAPLWAPYQRILRGSP